MSEGRWRITVTAPDWGEDHLTLDAIVAYVDDELGPGPYSRATRHVAHCDECAAQVVAQTQARAALRTAAGPRLPSALLSALCSIPDHADLPGPPADLAISEDGEFLYRAEPLERPARPERPARRGWSLPHRSAAGPDSPTLSLDTRPGAVADVLEPEAAPVEVPPTADHGRRVPVPRRIRLGTGVAVSGLALGALAFGVTAASPSVPSPVADRGVLGGTLLGGPGSSALSPSGLVDARLRLGRPTAGDAEPALGVPRGFGAALRSLW